MTAREDTATSKRPWAARAIELEPEAGHWADYAAWKEWFSAQEEKYPFIDGPTDILGQIGAVDDVTLYLICCNLADGAAEVSP